MSLTKLSLGGNNNNNKIIPAQGEFGQLHPGWGREIDDLFLHCTVSKAVNREDKRSRRYRDRDFPKFERSRRYRDR